MAISLFTTPTSFFGAITPPLAFSLNAELATKPVLLYQLLHNVQTISNLWKKWTIGLGSLTSIDKLDWLYGFCWHSGNEIQYYSIWKKIVNEIKRRAGSYATTKDYKAMVKEIEEKKTHSKA